jgi:6-phosphogluconolactonase
MIRILSALFLSLLPSLVEAQPGGAPEKYRVYIGTYTGKVSKGIYQCELDLKTGELSKATLAGETKDPSFLAFHPNKKFLYAVNERQESVSSFAIDAATGKLTALNSQPSGGGAPCHLIVDPTGKNVLAANYTGGSCICLPIDDDGKLAKASSFHQHKGAMIGKKKQAPHGHSIHVDKANKFAFCCDLGLDKVLVYRFDPAKGTLTPNDPAALDTPPGSGPRHFAWHPDGKNAYVNGESDMTIIACTYDADKGILTQKQVLSTLPKDAKRKGTSTAETVVHPSGKFVYVSNRGHNSLAIFAIDPKTRELKAVGHEARDISTPRNFAIEPTGQYLLVANETGGSVISFRINQATGELTPTGSMTAVASPVCVRFMAMGK